jgi:paraquat-inducible protein A
MFSSMYDVTVGIEVRHESIYEIVRFLFSIDENFVAILVTLFVIIVPFFLLLFSMIILGKKLLNKKQSKKIILAYSHLYEWNMQEVFLISVFITIVKLRDIYNLTLESGLVYIVAFVLAFYSSLILFNIDDIWHIDEENDDD